MNICREPNFLRLLLYVKIIIDILKIVASVLLVITGTLTFGKVVVDSKPDVPKAFKKFVGKILLAAAVFLLPTLFNWIFFSDNAITQNMGDFSACAKNMSFKKIAKIEEEIKDKTNDIKKEYANAPIKNNLTVFQNADGTTTNATTAVTSNGVITAETYFANWEDRNEPASCNANEYMARDQGDNTITVGYGLTNFKVDEARACGYSFIPMHDKDCIPKKDVDAVTAYVIERIIADIKKQAKSYNVTFNDNQIIALTNMGYNSSTLVKGAIKAYAAQGNAGLLNYLTNSISNVKGRYRDVIAKRRSADYEMFVYGYTDNVAKYYESENKYIKNY